MLNDKMLGEFLPTFKLGMIISLGKESETYLGMKMAEMNFIDSNITIFVKYQKHDDNIRDSVSVAFSCISQGRLSEW